MGGVIDGNPVNAAYTNPKFWDADGDDTGLGKYTLNDQGGTSGVQIDNMQKEFNSISFWLGRTANGTLTTLPSFTNNQGFGSDNLLARLDSISGKFHSLTGHAHTGNPGDAAQVQANAIASVPLQSYPTEGVVITGASGLTADVSSLLTGKVPSSTSTTAGVVVNTPYNYILITQGSGTNKGDKIVDSLGNAVFGRLTWAASVWTLSFYVNIAGTETAFTMPAQDVAWFYQELFSPLLNPPTYSPLFLIPSDNATADVVDASTTQRGLVNTTSQSFFGAKAFTSDLIAQAKLIGDIVVDSATTGASAALPAPAKLVVELTNASLTSIATITGGSTPQIFIAINNTGADVLLKSYTGTNGIYTGGNDSKFKKNAAALFVYVAAMSGWVVVSGSGGGGELKTEFRTLTSLEATNKVVVLAATPADPSAVLVDIMGGSGPQESGLDYYVFSNEVRWTSYALDGLLSSGDKIRFCYMT